MLNSSISSRCLDNMTNFSPLAAEIGSGVWGTPANFSGFRICLLKEIIGRDESNLNISLTSTNNKAEFVLSNTAVEVSNITPSNHKEADSLHLHLAVVDGHKKASLGRRCSGCSFLYNIPKSWAYRTVNWFRKW